MKNFRNIKTLTGSALIVTVLTIPLLVFGAGFFLPTAVIVGVLLGVFIAIPIWFAVNIIDTEELKTVVQHRTSGKVKPIGNLFKGAVGRLDLRRARLSESDLRHMDLQNTQLSWSSLYGADLEGANLQNADMSQADLRSANLKDVTVKNTKWEGAKFNEKTRLPFSKESALEQGMVLAKAK